MKYFSIALLTVLIAGDLQVETSWEKFTDKNELLYKASFCGTSDLPNGAILQFIAKKQVNRINYEGKDVKSIEKRTGDEYRARAQVESKKFAGATKKKENPMLSIGEYELTTSFIEAEQMNPEIKARIPDVYKPFSNTTYFRIGTVADFLESLKNDIAIVEETKTKIGKILDLFKDIKPDKTDKAIEGSTKSTELIQELKGKKRIIILTGSSEMLLDNVQDLYTYFLYLSSPKHGDPKDNKNPFPFPKDDKKPQDKREPKDVLKDRCGLIEPSYPRELAIEMAHLCRILLADFTDALKDESETGKEKIEALNSLHGEIQKLHETLCKEKKAYKDMAEKKISDVLSDLKTAFGKKGEEFRKDADAALKIIKSHDATFRNIKEKTQ